LFKVKGKMARESMLDLEHVKKCAARGRLPSREAK